jgi:hypothetical protein
VGLLAAVAVAALVAAVVLVRSLIGDDGDDPGDDRAGEPQAQRSTTAPETSAPTPEPSPTAPPPAPAVRCWDGTSAEKVADCSRPDGPAGLAWVFPNLSGQKCGAPTQTGPGVVLRILCTDRLADGTRVQIGYYQWQSVRAGIAFYDGQGLTRADDGGFLRWTGASGGPSGTAKSAALYGNAPFSLTVTLPGSVQSGAGDDRIFALRPPEQVRGEPAG